MHIVHERHGIMATADTRYAEKMESATDDGVERTNEENVEYTLVSRINFSCVHEDATDIRHYDCTTQCSESAVRVDHLCVSRLESGK